MKGGRKELRDFSTNQDEFSTDLFPQFTQVPIASGFGFSQLACGQEFSLLLTSNGNLLSTGSGTNGQHCLDNLKDRFEFLPIGSETAKGGFFD
jgi:alpha-tubulin suppressor-like RCC1 family protein